MNAPNENNFSLTEEHHMLLRIRDTLYEGSWAEFIHDLKARAEDKPHVFETLPPSPHLQASIAHHLDLITQMQQWETQSGRPLPCK